MDRKFLATTFTLTGTIIGAGILGLPYVFAKSGMLIGSLWLLILGVIMIYVNLCLGEISLSTKERHQLAGYAGKYLGKNYKKLMFFAVVFGVYSALIAYLIGEGQSLSQLFTGTLDYSIYFALGFWLLMTLLLRKGLKELKKVEIWGVGIIIILILGIFIFYFPKINFQNYYYNDLNSLFFPFGVILFALLGFTSIPELREEIKGSEKKLKKAIIIGTLIPIILYIMFSFIFVGVLGKNVTEVATLSFGSLITILGIFTMLTSYFVLSFSLNDIYQYDVLCSNKIRFFLVSLFPLIIYLVLFYFNQLDFVSILGIGGVISGGLTGILILLITRKVKQNSTRKSEYKMKISWPIIIFLTIIFILGIITQFIY